MLKRMESIKAIGLLNDANGSPYELKKAALIYADNGRGKSTIAAILRSCAQNVPALITNRKTLDSTLNQSVRLQFDNGHFVRFENGAWSEARAEILIFDADFVEQNVYSGSQVTPGQRQNLLHFALGVAAVNAQREYDLASTAVAQVATSIRELVSRISGLHSGKTLSQFQAIQRVDDADNKIAALRLQINAVENITAIRNKAIPKKLDLPTLDLASLFSILNKTLENIDLEAEEKVRLHFQKHGGGKVEGWAEQGQQFETNNECPYCGLALAGLDLVKSYRTYFNKSYKELTDQITNLPRGIDQRCGEQVIERILTQVASARQVIASWIQHVQLTDFQFDEGNSRSIMLELRTLLMTIANRKAANPISVVASESERQQAETLWNNLIQGVKSFNIAVDDRLAQINNFKATLAVQNLTILRQEIANLELAKRRCEVSSVDLLTHLETAKANELLAKQLKQQKKDTLTQIMDSTLTRYQSEINRLLTDFGASFQIQKMSTNFLGNGSPRSDYGISMRGQEVSLTSDNRGFKTSLSEGDKRTLAFAFFVASIIADQQISTKIVVIDDPMCSLDLNRKQKTIDVLNQIYLSANQLIVLAHDPYFIKKLRDAIEDNNGVINLSLFRLKHTRNEYSEFDRLDIDRLCETIYFKHHRILNEYTEGVNHSISEVSKAIRPMLEGYLHRRFPGMISHGLMFGQLISHIQSTVLPHPLANAHPIVQALIDINSYVWQFHHDTNPAADQVVIVESELRTYVNKALSVVYKGEL